MNRAKTIVGRTLLWAVGLMIVGSLGVTGSWDEMFQAVARAHKGEQQQAGSLAEEEFIPGVPQVIGML